MAFQTAHPPVYHKCLFCMPALFECMRCIDVCLLNNELQYLVSFIQLEQGDQEASCTHCVHKCLWLLSV